MRKQQLVGLAFIAISTAILMLAIIGKTATDRDVTPMCITLPVGVYLIRTKRDALHDRDGPAMEAYKQRSQDPKT